MSKYLPSKKFLKFFGLVAGIGLIIWLVSFFIFKKETYKAPQENLISESSGDLAFYTIDTDMDGVKDWEESLWQTNPLSKDTDEDGIEDLEEIEIRRKEIEKENDIESDESSTENLTQTEIFARQFFSTVSLANQQGEITEETLDSFGSAFGDAVKDSYIEDTVSLADIHLSGISKADYEKSFYAVANPLAAKNISEFKVINDYVANMDEESEMKLDEAIEAFQQLSNGLMEIKAPYQTASVHLSMINNSIKISIGLANIKNLETDPLLAVVGLNQFMRYSGEFEKDIVNLQDYFSTRDIIQ